MDRIFTKIIDDASDGKTVEQVIRKTYNMSTKLITRLKFDGRLIVNDVPVKTVHVVHSGDVLKVVIPVGTGENIVPVKLDFKICFEDEDILVADKPALMSVHPSMNNFDNTLANAVCYHWQQMGTPYSYCAVNRLDKGTSGLLIIAKNSHVHNMFMHQIQKREIKRCYTALVHGCVANDEGTIDAPICRADDSVITRIVSPQGQRAVTHYKVVKRMTDKTLVRVVLETGRTHQIRVHFQYIGHSLVGDWLYGGDTSLLNRQALHSSILDFTHPITGENMHFESDLPQDIAALTDE